MEKSKFYELVVAGLLASGMSFAGTALAAPPTSPLQGDAQWMPSQLELAMGGAMGFGNQMNPATKPVKKVVVYCEPGSKCYFSGDHVKSFADLSGPAFANLNSAMGGFQV